MPKLKPSTENPKAHLYGQPKYIESPESNSKKSSIVKRTAMKKAFFGFMLANLTWLSSNMTSFAMTPHAKQNFVAQVPDRQNLLQAGDSFLDIYDFSSALEQYQRLLIIVQQQNDYFAEATVLYRLGLTYQGLREIQLAVNAYQGALDILNTLDLSESSQLKTRVLYDFAQLYYSSSEQNQAAPERDRAERFLYEVIELSSKSDVDPFILGLTFHLLALIKADSGNFENALNFHTQALSIFERLNRSKNQISALISIGNIWSLLGDFEEATSFYNQALKVNGESKHPRLAGKIWGNLGMIQALQNNYLEALAFYQRAFTIKEQSNDKLGMGQTLNNMGDAYIHQGDLQQALVVLTRALTLVDSIENFGTKASIRDTLGMAYAASSDSMLAWQSYHQSLRLSIFNQDRRRALITTLNLAQLAQQSSQPLVAIAFYKQAINEIESVRSHLRSLPLETQQRYTETVSDSYRALAALLLDQARVFEAQQVLDLLKIQELEDYLRDVREDQPIAVVPYLEAEQTLLDWHQRLLLEGLSEDDPVLSLADFLNHPDVATAIETLERAGTDPTLQPESLRQLQQKLQQLPHPSVVLYPLVLEDRLELLLIPPDGLPIRRTRHHVTRPLLQQKVAALREELQAPSGTVRPIAGQLYDWIIWPFQAELKQLDIENIIYIPDDVLHYVPLSVLYNSSQKQWLAEQYTSHNLTASSIGDLIQPPSSQLNILAGAFTDTNQSFEKQVGEQMMPLPGLAHAGQEVAFLQDYIPDTQVLLDTAFNLNNLKTKLPGQNIMHLATHAAFVPGRPEDSFILLGDGTTLTLADLRHWSPHMSGIDLVVLSACQTGISQIEDGLEILGMGFQVQRTDALAAMASLWWVNDQSTAQLMQQFYRELANGETKVKALQQAQLNLIDQGFREPYYWAPFVLIGNGL